MAAPSASGTATPDASWGHRSAVSTRAAGSFYGYELHLLACTRTGLPLAWEVHTARRNESLYVAPLLDKARAAVLSASGFTPTSPSSDD